MELITALVGSASDGSLFTCDCLRDGGELWLVTSWYETQDGLSRSPAIAIRVDRWLAQETPRSVHQVLVHPLSIAVLNGEMNAAPPCETLREQKAEARFGWLPVRAAS